MALAPGVRPGPYEIAAQISLGDVSCVLRPSSSLAKGDAPGWRPATSESTGLYLSRSNAASRDAAPAECSGTSTTGC